jgi:hypothetical protein
MLKKRIYCEDGFQLSRRAPDVRVQQKWEFIHDYGYVPKFYIEEEQRWMRNDEYPTYCETKDYFEKETSEEYISIFLDEDNHMRIHYNEDEEPLNDCLYCKRPVAEHERRLAARAEWEVSQWHYYNCPDIAYNRLWFNKYTKAPLPGQLWEKDYVTVTEDWCDKQLQ